MTIHPTLHRPRISVLVVSKFTFAIRAGGTPCQWRTISRCRLAMRSSSRGAGFDVHAASPKQRGGVGARITTIVLLPIAPVLTGRALTKNSAPRHEPVICDRPGQRGQGARTGRKVEFQRHRRFGEQTDGRTTTPPDESFMTTMTMAPPTQFPVRLADGSRYPTSSRASA